MNRSVRALWLSIAVVVFIANPASSVLIDGFEDGNISANPAWFITYGAGPRSVEFDPFPLGNRVYRSHGSEGAQDITPPMATRRSK